MLFSVFVAGGAQAAEPGVTCGSTVTTDVTLTADLYCPSGDGLILGTNVTLDLGGHSLIGSGSGVGVQTDFLSDGGNTVRNGTIENWATGLRFAEASPMRPPHVVADVKLQKAPLIHLLSGGAALQMTHVTAVDSGISGQLDGNLEISESRLTRSPIDLFYAGATITNSTLVQSPFSTTALGQVLIDSSKLDGKGAGRPGSVSETGITISNSVVKNFAQPISGYWGGVTLTGNRFSDMPNGVLGDISSPIGSDGVSIIKGNTFLRTGIALRGNVPMIVEGNTFKHGEVGVEFTRSEPFPGDPPLTAEGSRAVGNVLTNNSGSGISARIAGVEVGGNIATKNGGYGIDAPGAIDLGGNVAFKNDLGQCVGVVCTRR
ncbi:right-handed parallel beta-helix repeat-containing protein [Microbacterium sp. DT81.1]|uniref:right-handed parallel beta-helix repeat-containing protein n=1 Tax=Microbacterium sp. DT81.1 TaxID=3393413 RepID=UPI003CEE783E